VPPATKPIEGDPVTERSKLRNPLLAVALAAVLAASAVACSSNDDSAATTTTAAETTTTEAEVTTTTEADDTTTTTEANGGAECSPEALANAGSASGPGGNFDTVDNYGCDDGYAWAWLSDSSGATTAQISEIFEDDGGSWSSLSLDSVCGGASAGYPPEIVQNGCAFYDNGSSDTGDDTDDTDDTDANDANDGDTTD